MIVFERQAAIQAFYYLMAVDGTVQPEELAAFDSIGNEIDPEEFASYRDVAIEVCEEQLASLIEEEDYYEVVLEGVDKALSFRTEDVQNGVPVRLLIWNMLVIALSNGEFSALERKLIKHIVRTMDVEHSVFIEMEQIIKTNVSVEQQLAWITKSDRPYAEIRPIVEELERRQNIIVTCAKRLIEDELYAPIEKIAMRENKLYVGARDTAVKIGSTVASKTMEWGKKTAEVTKAAASGIGKQTKGIFGRKNSDGSNEE